MSIKGDNILKAMELAIKFISKLNEEQLDKLINKDFIFDIKPKKKKIVETNDGEAKEFNEIESNLKNFSSREEATKYITSLNFKNDKLIRLGKHLNIKIPTKKVKKERIDIIVEETIGNKLKVESIRKAIMGKEKETK